MSAFVVTYSHIDAIVRAAQAYRARLSNFSWGFLGSEIPDPTDPERKTIDGATFCGKILLEANASSVAYRYKDQPEAALVAAYRYDWKRAPKLDGPALIKAIDCLEYQSCERPDWRETQAAKMLHELRSAAIAALPGYDSAAWSLRAY